MMSASCKQDQGALNKEDTKQVVAHSAEPKGTVTEAITELRNSAKAVYDFRMNNGKPVNAQVFDQGVWEYEFTFAKGEMSKPGALSGKWIDFLPDNTYEYGWHDTIKGSGIYHFDSENMVALLIDNAPSAKPTEYDVKIAMDVMVIIGTTTYNDKSTQSKLVNVSERPTK